MQLEEFGPNFAKKNLIHNAGNDARHTMQFEDMMKE